jgi:hypothetical protein
VARRCEESAVRRLGSSAAAVDDEFDACDVGGVVGVRDAMYRGRASLA